MPDFLDGVIARTMAAEPAVRPRVTAIFEPVRPGWPPSPAGGEDPIEIEEPTAPARTGPATASSPSARRRDAASPPPPPAPPQRRSTPATSRAGRAVPEVPPEADAPPAPQPDRRRPTRHSPKAAADPAPAPAAGSSPASGARPTRSAAPAPAPRAPDVRTRPTPSERPAALGAERSVSSPPPPSAVVPPAQPVGPWDELKARLRRLEVAAAAAAPPTASVEAGPDLSPADAAASAAPPGPAPLPRAGPSPPPAVVAASTHAERFAAPSAAPTLVQVTIGRVEVRAASAPAPAAPKHERGRAADRPTALDEYLNRRNGTER